MLRHGCLERIAQDCVWAAFEDLQEGMLLNLPGKPLPVPCHLCSTEVLPGIQMEPLVFRFVSIASSVSSRANQPSFSVWILLVHIFTASLDLELETIGWQLNLEMSATTQAKLKSPRAVLELGVSNEDSKNLKKVFVEFSHQELFEFYNKLETIQAQLDSLT
ncbi:COMM domain-containing protein 10 isoform X4 [Numida meleagris]|uniref:COMM domain-containing protein 10 isoform X4 n=1 Tax=Numida meleagris TaxID=8996 RepID=UPI000B3D97C6|nr:COMM domain-containing protein 10 isoform X4 [Numida meleagris]